MRIGIIAPEFPPTLGGMAELARGLATAMAERIEVQVYSFAQKEPGPAAFSPLKDVLTGRPWIDGPRLAQDENGPGASTGTEPHGAGQTKSPQGIDLWLCLNAGLIPAVKYLDRPFFAYLHGNDFINPWLPCGPKLLEAVKRPYMADLRHALRRKSIAACLPKIRHLLTNSGQTADLIRRHFDVAKQGVSVAHPGVGEAFFQDREPYDGDALRILTVTRISSHTRRKNVDGVLRALARIGDRFPWHYTVVGDGDDRPRLEQLAVDLGIDSQVTFLGSVSFDDLLAAYRRADLFVLTSRATTKDVEGFGIVYIESSAGGVPVICSREGGATDAVRDGVNGLLIDKSDPQSIAEGIERFHNERERFSPEAARQMAEEFRWPVIAGQVHDILMSKI